MTGVYEIKCVKNGKRYVGVSKDIERRWREHRGLLYRGQHHSYDMQCDYNKFGENCFEFNVLKSCDYPEAKVCVGGAVLTQQIADEIGADHYSADAMDSVRLLEEIIGSK